MQDPFTLEPFDFDDPEAQPTPDLYPTIATIHETSLLPLSPLPPSSLVTDPEVSNLLDHSLQLDTSINSTQEDGPPSASSNLGDGTFDHSLQPDPSANPTLADAPPLASSTFSDLGGDTSVLGENDSNTLESNIPACTATIPGPTHVQNPQEAHNAEEDEPSTMTHTDEASEYEPDESELVDPSNSLSAGGLEGDLDDSVFHEQSEGEDDSDGQANDLALSTTTFHTTPTPTEDGGMEGDHDLALSTTITTFHTTPTPTEDGGLEGDHDLALSTTTTTFHTTPTPTEDGGLEGDHGHNTSDTGSSSAALDEEDTATLLSRTIDSTFMDLTSSLTPQSLPLSLIPDLPAHDHKTFETGNSSSALDEEDITTPISHEIGPHFEDLLGSLDPQLSPLLTIPLEPSAALTGPHSSATITTDENLEDLAGPSTPTRLENQNDLNSDVGPQSEYRRDTGDLDQFDDDINIHPSASTLSTITLPDIDVTPPNSPMFEDLFQYIGSHGSDTPRVISQEVSEANLEQSLYSVQPEIFGGERILVPPSPEAPQIELLPSSSEDDQSLSYQPVSDPLEHEDIIQLQSDPVADPPDVPAYDHSTPDTRSSSPLLSEDDYVDAHTELSHETSSRSNLSITTQLNVQNQASIRSPTAFERIQSGILHAIPTLFALNRDSSATGSQVT